MAEPNKELVDEPGQQENSDTPNAAGDQEEIMDALDSLDISSTVSNNIASPSETISNTSANTLGLNNITQRTVGNNCDIELGFGVVCKDTACATPYHTDDVSPNLNVVAHNQTAIAITVTQGNSTTRGTQTALYFQKTATKRSYSTRNSCESSSDSSLEKSIHKPIKTRSIHNRVSPLPTSTVQIVQSSLLPMHYFYPSNNVI